MHASSTQAPYLCFRIIFDNLYVNYSDSLQTSSWDQLDSCTHRCKIVHTPVCFVGASLVLFLMYVDDFADTNTSHLTMCGGELCWLEDEEWFLYSPHASDSNGCNRKILVSAFLHLLSVLYLLLLHIPFANLGCCLCGDILLMQWFVNLNTYFSYTHRINTNSGFKRITWSD